MHLELIRDPARELPAPAQPASVRTARLWHCKYRSLAPLAAMVSLEELVVATFPDDTLDVLASLVALRYLRVLHMPRVTELAPLASLTRLATLRLETLPSWDASSRKTVVRSLEPLVQLPALEHLELFGVVPDDRSLAPLERCASLRSVRVSKFPKREVDRFYRVTGLRSDHAPPASSE